MALSANTVWEVQTGGSDTNGGGFVTGASGTDYSLVASKRTATGANDSTTNAVAVGTGVITSTTAAFTSAIVGNVIYLQGGTGSLAAGWYQVTVFTSATSITVDRNVAAGTGITMNIGGAFASVGNTGAAGLVTGQIIYIKAGTYSISSASTNVSNGVISNSLFNIFVGYNTNRTLTNTDTKPVLQFTTSGVTMFNSRSLIRNLQIDGNSQTTSAYATGSSAFDLCKFTNLTATSGLSSCSRCEATGCSAAQFVGDSLFCVAHANTATPFSNSIASNVAAIFSSCLSYGNTGASTDGFSLGGSGSVIASNLTAYGNGRDGIRCATGRGTILLNSISEGNTGSNINVNSVQSVQLINCATPTAVANTVNTTIAEGTITPSGSVFTNAGSADFSLNNTAGAGALLRAAGYPGILPVGGTGYLDIGILQHQDSGGSSSILVHPGMVGGMRG